MSKIVTVVKNTYTDLTTHWSKPAKGNFVSYKEIINLGLGGMGQQLCITFFGYMSLGAGNMLLGSTIGIRPMHLQYMAMIQTVLNIFACIVRGKIVDNTRTKYGRFRPYIALMGFPLVLITAIYIFLPIETMAYTNKLILTFLFAIVVSLTAPLFTDTYSELGTVITPNSEERAKVTALNSLIYSFAPTLYWLFVPMFSNLTGGFTNIKTYRFVIVPCAVLGVGLNLFTAFGCKERVITSENYVQKVGIIEGCLEIFKNKHWWIRNIAGYVGFLESACGVMFSWIYVYGTQDMTQYGVLNTVLGTASGIAFVISPWIIKKLGNRKLLLAHNALNVIFITFMYFTYKIPLFLFIFIYLNSLINALSTIYNPVMHAEVKDYQQYLSGKRMDFMFGVAGLVGTPITMLTGLVIPYVYESMGVTTNYDILFDPFVRNSMFRILCILSISGAFLNLIPFAFYSLSKEKHINIIKVLRYRALFDDYENDCLKREDIVTTVKAVREAQEQYDVDVKAVESGKGKKAAKKAAVLKDAAAIMIDEIHKYESKFNMFVTAKAKETVRAGFDGVKYIRDDVVIKARELPNNSAEEKKIRKFAVKNAKALLKMRDAAAENYPDGIFRVTEQRVKAAYDMPQNTPEETRTKKLEIKAAQSELDRFTKTLKPFLNAEEQIRLSDISKTFYCDLEKMYEQIEKEPAGNTNGCLAEETV